MTKRQKTSDPIRVKKSHERPLGLCVSDPEAAASKLADVNGVCLLSDNGSFMEKDSSIIAISRIRNGTNHQVVKQTKLNWWEKVTLENLLGRLKRCSTSLFIFSQTSHYKCFRQTNLTKVSSQ